MGETAEVLDLPKGRVDTPEPPRKRSRAEWESQAAFWVFLQKALPPGAFSISIDEAAKRSKDANMARRRRGCLGGVPDLLIFHGRTLLCLEAKSGTGSHQSNQKAFQDGILRNGGHYAVVKTLDEVEAACLEAGIPLRATLGDIRSRITEQNARLPVKRKKGGARPGQPVNQMSLAQYRRHHAGGRV